MSLLLESALESMSEAWVVFYPYNRCGDTASVRLRFSRGLVGNRVMQMYNLCFPEFLRWISCGMPGLSRCFECPYSGECNNGSDCEFPVVVHHSPCVGSSLDKPKNLGAYHEVVKKK